MVSFFAVLLRSVVAVFVGVLFAGGTLTLAADRVPVDRPTLVPVSAGPTTLTVPDVQSQPYVFAKSILQENGFAWHVSGPVQGYAANTVAEQRPAAGTTVVDTGAPTITLSLARNSSYLERGTPENDAPYAGTEIRIAATPPRPTTLVKPRLEPVQIPTFIPTLPTPTTPTTAPAPPTTPTTPAPTPAPTPTTTTPSIPAPTTPTPTVRTPDFQVTGAPKEPQNGAALPDRATELSRWIETHKEPTPANLNHWLYEHSFIVAGAKFGWWHGVEALEILIEVDKRAESLWGVGVQSRTTAQQALVEVTARRS